MDWTSPPLYGVRMSKELSFEKEINWFFRACPEEERSRVGSNPFYQEARHKCDIARGEEIAAEILEGNMPTKESARLLNRLMA